MDNIYKPVAMFKYNNTKYCIVVVNNNICFFKYENGKVIPAYSKEELKLFLAVHNSLKIDTDNHYPLRVEKLDGKDIEVFYDINTRLYFGYRLENGNRYNLNEEESFKFNYKYNYFRAEVSDNDGDKEEQDNGGFLKFYDWNDDETLSIYDEDEKLQKKREDFRSTRKEINRKNRIKSIKTFSAIGIMAAMFLTTNFLVYSHTSLADSLRKALNDQGIYVSEKADAPKESEDLLEQLKSQEYDSNMIETAMDNNIHLGIHEKNFIKNLKFLFDENSSYMDTELARKRFETLRIKYSKEENENPELKGMYSRINNEIIFFGASNFANVDKNIFLHEIMHVCQLGESERLTMELSNELLTRECIRRMDENGLIEKNEIFADDTGNHTVYGAGYDPCMLVEYILADILTPQQLKSYQFTTRDDLLINYLADIEAGDKDYTDEEYKEYQNHAVQLLDAIETLRYRDGGAENDRIDFTKEKYMNIIRKLEPYYVKKHGITIEESMRANLMCFDERYKEDIAYSDLEHDALYITLKSILKERSNPEEQEALQNLKDNYIFTAHVLPKTYFSIDHKNPTLILDTGNVIKLEIKPEYDQIYKEKYGSLYRNIVENNFSEER